MPTFVDFLRFVRRLAIVKGTFYVPYFVSRLANPVNSMSVWNKILQPVCADTLAQHDRVTERLGLVLKTLVTTEGRTVREGVFHLQHVNAHHSTLKSWVNNWFKGVASKYLYRYVGWRRALSTCDLTVYRLIEKLAGGWLYQLQS